MTIIVFLLLLSVTMVIILRCMWIRESKLRRYFIKLCITGFTFILLFLVVEVFFRFFVIQTDNLGFTLAAKLWYSKYWIPINSFGYRDIEHTKPSLNGKKIIFVVGDSFVAGAGIKNYKDRFSNILQKNLGEDYVTINIARPGWATEDEYNAILSYPYKPDIIILSYNWTDIEGSAKKMGIDINKYKSTIPSPTSGIIKYFFNTSYFFNYCYYRLYRFYKSNDITQIYSNFLDCPSNEMIWQDHKKSLFNIISYAKNQNIELIVVVFPFLRPRHAIIFSKNFSTKIVDFMNFNKVTVIDLTDKLIGRNPQELIVNSFDSHPSVKLHKEIANLLVEYVYQVENKHKENIF